MHKWNLSFTMHTFPSDKTFTFALITTCSNSFCRIRIQTNGITPGRYFVAFVFVIRIMHKWNLSLMLHTFPSDKAFAFALITTCSDSFYRIRIQTNGIIPVLILCARYFVAFVILIGILAYSSGNMTLSKSKHIPRSDPTYIQFR